MLIEELDSKKQDFAKVTDPPSSQKKEDIETIISKPVPNTSQAARKNHRTILKMSDLLPTQKPLTTARQQMLPGYSQGSGNDK